MKKYMLLSAGIIAVLVGLALVMPALAQYLHEGAMSGEEVGLLVLGAALTLGGAWTAVLFARRHRA